jgi:hypothetical protein
VTDDSESPIRTIEVIRSLTLSVQLKDASDTLRAFVTVTNPTPRTASFGVSTFPCSVVLRFYSQAGDLVWDQQSNSPHAQAAANGLPWS